MFGGQVEMLLQVKGEFWMFFVCESFSQFGDFVFFVFSDQFKVGLGFLFRVIYIKVMCEGGCYIVGGLEIFDSFMDLVEYFKKMGIEEVLGVFVYLWQLYYVMRVNVVDIEN